MRHKGLRDVKPNLPLREVINSNFSSQFPLTILNTDGRQTKRGVLDTTLNSLNIFAKQPVAASGENYQSDSGSKNISYNKNSCILPHKVSVTMLRKYF